MERGVEGSMSIGKLRAQWGLFCGAAIAIILVFSWLTRQETFSTLWMFVALFFLLYQTIILYFDLNLNRAGKSGKLLSGFGPGTWLSLIRLLLLSLLAGFLVTPRYENWLAWVPFTLYLMFNLIDLLDGYAARRWGKETLLGKKLDLDLDGRGMLVGSLMAVLGGMAGWWYLLVGLARYLFVLGIWLRRKLRLPVIEKPNPLARPLAGLQMGVTTALLVPVLHPPFTILTSSLVMLPFLSNFLYDWLVIGKKKPARQASMPDLVTKWIPLALRFLLFILVANAFLSRGSVSTDWYIEILLAAGIFLGFSVRLFGLLLLTQIGLTLQSQAIGSYELLLSLCSLILVYFGPGMYSIWTSEASILRRRLGEKPGK
jgi:CDP-diacylglycerol--glycerol-3-phosphate 3-phosphatidyltransferase